MLESTGNESDWNTLLNPRNVFNQNFSALNDPTSDFPQHFNISKKKGITFWTIFTFTKFRLQRSFLNFNRSLLFKKSKSMTISIRIAMNQFLYFHKFSNLNNNNAAQNHESVYHVMFNVQCFITFSLIRIYWKVWIPLTRSE